MAVNLVFKNVADEALIDDEFLRVTRKAVLDVSFLHQEFDATAAGRTTQ